MAAKIKTLNNTTSLQALEAENKKLLQELREIKKHNFELIAKISEVDK